MARARKTALLATSTVRAFDGALPPTMPSADFCAAIRSPHGDPSLVVETRRRPPEVRPTAFAARLPDLPPRPLMTVDFAIIGSLVRPGRPRYPVLVHRAAALLRASFRPRLAATPPAFAGAGSCALLILRSIKLDRGLAPPSGSSMLGTLDARPKAGQDDNRNGDPFN